jgi:3D (Asp-Asp-Asp) domain-containing protein
LSVLSGTGIASGSNLYGRLVYKGQNDVIFLLKIDFTIPWDIKINRLLSLFKSPLWVAVTTLGGIAALLSMPMYQMPSQNRPTHFEFQDSGWVLPETHRPTDEVPAETIREITAYNVGDPAQTSGDPCESANGEDICAALKAGLKRCAANFVPLGSQLNIAAYGVCTVTDRMNGRYKNRVDLAMRIDEKEKALQLGLQKRRVTILKTS